jgi:hypothetical protein
MRHFGSVLSRAGQSAMQATTALRASPTLQGFARGSLEASKAIIREAGTVAESFIPDIAVEAGTAFRASGAGKQIIQHLETSGFSKAGHLFKAAEQAGINAGKQAAQAIEHSGMSVGKQTAQAIEHAGATAGKQTIKALERAGLEAEHEIAHVMQTGVTKAAEKGAAKAVSKAADAAESAVGRAEAALDTAAAKASKDSATAIKEMENTAKNLAKVDKLRKSDDETKVSELKGKAMEGAKSAAEVMQADSKAQAPQAAAAQPKQSPKPPTMASLATQPGFNSTLVGNLLLQQNPSFQSAVSGLKGNTAYSKEQAAHASPPTAGVNNSVEKSSQTR